LIALNYRLAAISMTVAIAAPLAPWGIGSVSADAVCWGDTVSLGILEATGGAANSTYYVDDRGTVFGDGTYFYQESNGIWVPTSPGVHPQTDHSSLQTGGSASLGLGQSDLCSDMTPDTLIF
jgi:hypothetical protein